MSTPEAAVAPPSQESLTAVFHALSDPTRRHLIRSLAGDGRPTPSALAAGLPITRQAVAKHLSALADAGIVTSVRTGRETHYELAPQPLTDAARWITAVGAEWDERLADLRAVLSQQRERG